MNRFVSRSYTLIRVLGCLLVSLLLLAQTSCSSDGYVKERKVDYRQSRTLPRLDVPPDLSQVEARGPGVLPPTTALGTSTYSSFTSTRNVSSGRAQSNVLPRSESIRVERDGVRRWLVVESAVERVWQRVREFWQQQGFLIRFEDPRLGIIETDWAENRADIPTGGLRKLIGKAFDFAYSAPTRDKYRVRLEVGAEPGTTELFLTHWGVKEVVTGTTSAAGTADTVWEPRPSNPELEAEFLNRLMVYLGVTKEQATQRLAVDGGQPRARLITESEGKVLEVDERFSRAWRLSGIALDHLGFIVEERDRRSGIYRVRATEPLRELQQEKGFFSKLAFWRDDEEELLKSQRFVVLVTENGDSTRIKVDVEKSDLPNAAEAAGRVLAMLEQQLR